MIVRYETTHDGTFLIVDECEKFLGECTSDDFIECMEDRDSFEEDFYWFFYVDKEKLNLCFQSFCAEKIKEIILDDED